MRENKKTETFTEQKGTVTIVNSLALPQIMYRAMYVVSVLYVSPEVVTEVLKSTCKTYNCYCTNFRVRLKNVGL